MKKIVLLTGLYIIILQSTAFCQFKNNVENKSVFSSTNYKVHRDTFACETRRANGYNDRFNCMYNKLTKKLDSIGWKISSVLVDSITTKIVGSDSYGWIIADTLVYSALLSQEPNFNNPQPIPIIISPQCQVIDGLSFCKGTVVLENAAGGDRVRSKSIILPKFNKISGADFSVFNITDQAREFYIKDKFINPNLNQTESQVSINAQSVSSSPVKGDIIICNYFIWGNK